MKQKRKTNTQNSSPTDSLPIITQNILSDMISSLKTFSLISMSCTIYTSSLYAQDDKAASDEVAPAKVKQIDNQEQKQLAGIVHFFNGDSISGEINGWDTDQITITSPDLLDPAIFSTSTILNITLNDNRGKALEAGINVDETTLVINNRDNQKGLHGIIKGGFSNIDDTHVTLKTNYAGEIKVLKKFITKMEIDSKKGYLYLGPKSLDEWHNNSIKQTWEYTNNSLISGSQPGNIAQDLGMPEEASISFDLSWKEDEYITLFVFSSDHEQSKPDNYYQINLQNRSCSVLKYVDGRQVSHIRSEKQQARGNRFPIQPQRRTPIVKELHAHYDIYLSKATGEFHIYRNGDKLDTFTDTEPQVNKFGSALHLISSNKTPIRVKNLSLSKWSGHIPSAIDAETFAKVKGEGERILLKNGDILLGKIGKVRDGLMQVETVYTQLNIPIIRMRSVDLTGSKLKEEPIMYQNDIKCWFKDKGWIILKPISIDGNTLTAYHQALGENKFDLNVFKRIDLHIYDKEANANRKSDSW